MNNEVFDKSVVNVNIKVPYLEWKQWCEESKEMGLTGEELLTLVFQELNEVCVDARYFDEMHVIPSWAYEKLKKIEKSYEDRKRIDFFDEEPNEWDKVLMEIR